MASPVVFDDDDLDGNPAAANAAQPSPGHRARAPAWTSASLLAARAESQKNSHAAALA